MTMKKISLVLVLLLLFTYGISYAGTRGTEIASSLGIKDAKLQEVKGIEVAKILGVMQWVGIAIAVGMIIFCGIKFVMSGAGEKAKVKETLIPILIGAVLIACAVTITEIVFAVFGK